jgi:hypothetical protein
MIWLLPLLMPRCRGIFFAYSLSPASAVLKRATEAVAALQTIDTELRWHAQDISEFSFASSE